MNTKKDRALVFDRPSNHLNLFVLSQVHLNPRRGQFTHRLLEQGHPGLHHLHPQNQGLDCSLQLTVVPPQGLGLILEEPVLTLKNINGLLVVQLVLVVL